MPTSNPRRRPAGRETVREERLQWTVRAAAWWLLAQGALYLVLTADSAVRLNLRFDRMLEPYVRLLALTQLCLGFFLLKALRDPRRQYLAVDVLILYLLGHVYFLLSYRLGYGELSPFEWFSGLVDFILGVSLALHRTRSTEMRGAGTVLSANALEVVRETGQWVRTKGATPVPTLGGLDAGEDEKGGSEVLPHLD